MMRTLTLMLVLGNMLVMVMMVATTIEDDRQNYRNLESTGETSQHTIQ